jgi:hypothetical protein
MNTYKILQDSLDQALIGVDETKGILQSAIPLLYLLQLPECDKVERVKAALIILEEELRIIRDVFQEQAKQEDLIGGAR